MDSEFLKKLDSHRSREVFAKLISLDFQENPIEQIEGRVTGGSINIDGASAVRRTCSVSMVAKEMNINEFYWGLYSKFKLEIGLKNFVDDKYSDIIWFPQGTYVITSFSTNQTTNNYTVSISGKDKMCLLNGEVGGNLPASIDFGVEEYHDLEAETTYYNKIPIKQIIREALHTYALEPYHNIIIEDLEEAGLELLEYRGEDPIYLLYDIETNEYENTTLNGDMTGLNEATKEMIALNDPKFNYFPRVDLIDTKATVVTFPDSQTPNKRYQVARLEYGQTAGYNITELVYAGDLISSIGETLTSILDKIKNMLGEFEYFYDIDGRFVFRRKKIYINNTFSTITNTEDDKYVENSAYNHQTVYTFEGGNLITAYQNAPNLNNLRNDYSIWGTRKGVSGAEIPVHYRFAIDKKPISYTSIEVTQNDIDKYTPLHKEVNMKPQDSVTYTTKDWDWRELIYQMAKDYYQYGQLESFLSKVIKANPDLENGGSLYPNGRTGYEQYYIDIQGFWRDLYKPNAEPTVFDYEEDGLISGEPAFIFDKEKYPYGLFIEEGYVKYDDSLETDKNRKEKREKVYVNRYSEKTERYEMQPLLDSIVINFNFDEKTGEQPYHIEEVTGKKYKYVITSDDGYQPIIKNILNRIEKKEIFIGYFDENNGLITEEIIPLICFPAANDNWYYKENFKEVKKIEDYFNEVPGLINMYVVNETENKYYNYIPLTPLNIYGKEDNEGKVKKTYINYFFKEYEYYREEDKETKYLYWNKNITEAPDTLNFWMDFLDTDGELSQFAVQVVGNRPKVINDKDVKNIYFRQVPEIIYIDSDDTAGYELIELADYWHYTRIRNLPKEQFTISAQGKSAQNALEELLYNHSYCIESITLTAVPIYYLTPNTRILVIDESSKINGEYLVNRISIPLTYNGMMSINATKAPTRLF